MRRFVKTLFVKRAAQFTVIQDGAARQFEVWCWRPGTGATTGLRLAQAFPYDAGAAAAARQAAIAEMQRLHQAERHGAPA